MLGLLALLLVAPLMAERRKWLALSPAVGQQQQLADNDRRRYDYFFFEAIKQQNAEHYDAAFDLLNHCLHINPNAAEAYYMQAMYLSQLKLDSLSLQYLEKAAALRPENDAYLERVAQYYLGDNDIDKSIETLEKLYAGNHERTNVLNILAKLYEQKKDYDKLLDVIGRIEQVEGASEETALAKMRVYELKGDSKVAFKSLKALAEQHPNDLNYKVMMGNWLMQHKKQGEAYKIFANVLKEEPDNAYAQSSMYDYHVAVGDTLMAIKVRDAILSSPKTPSNTKLTLVQQFIQNTERQGGDSTKVMAFLDQVMASNPTDGNMAQLYAAYVHLKHMPDSVKRHALEHVLALSPDNAGARLQLIQNELSANTVNPWPENVSDSIISISRLGTQYNPEEMAFYYYLGVSYYMKNDIDNALRALRQGVGEIKEDSDPSIVSDFYGYMGDMLHQKGLRQEAYAAYDSCLQWKDDNIMCLNNYAYFLSEEGGDLQKAEQMSFKTVKAEPKNATFLDTYAWILFRQERYAEAKIYMDQALQNDSDISATLLEHLGDIYVMNALTDQAVDFWQQALKKADTEEGKALLRKKIKQRKYLTK